MVEKLPKKAVQTFRYEISGKDTIRGRNAHQNSPQSLGNLNFHVISKVEVQRVEKQHWDAKRKMKDFKRPKGRILQYNSSRSTVQISIHFLLQSSQIVSHIRKIIQ